MTAESGERSHGPRVSVLLVDDEPALLEASARLLRASKISVTECDSAEKAATLIERESFDVIVSDLAMPGLGGIELLRRLRAKQIDVPVVFLTGAPALDTAMKAVELGAFKYLTKPVDRHELVSTVEDAARSADVRSGARERRSAPGTVSAAPMTLAVGSVVGGRYTLRAPLGAGGMGMVWEATHLTTARPVALKVLHPSVNARPDMRRRLLREARATTTLVHPNTVQVLDVFELEDGSPVMLMELLRGETLRAHLDAVKALPTAEACGVLVQVVSAVGAAHANGIVHRDIKPENVMLCRSAGDTRALVKVMDFGVAKLVYVDPRDATSATAVGAAVGTLGYMAPEQAFGESDVDHRADVWAVGAVLYEALSGARPVPGTTLGQIITHQLTERPTPLAERMPELPEALTTLVDRMLARERDDRPADLREVHLELARHTDVVAPPFGPPVWTGAHGLDADRSAMGHARTEVPAPMRRRGT